MQDLRPQLPDAGHAQRALQPEAPRPVPQRHHRRAPETRGDGRARGGGKFSERHEPDAGDGQAAGLGAEEESETGLVVSYFLKHNYY